VADAGLTIDDVDGLASFADDRNEAIYLAAELGLPALRFGNMVWMPGGGGGCAAVGNAAMAVRDGPGGGRGRLPLAVPGPVLPLRHRRARRVGAGRGAAEADREPADSLMMAWMASRCPTA
jgi:hypothetical protein